MNKLLSLKYLKQLCEKSNKEMLRCHQKYMCIAFLLGTISTTATIYSLTDIRYTLFGVLAVFVTKKQ